MAVLQTPWLTQLLVLGKKLLTKFRVNQVNQVYYPDLIFSLSEFYSMYALNEIWELFEKMC